MLAQASCSQLVAVVREELATTVLPRVTDDVARISLGMIDSVLRHVQNRADDETQLMGEEVAAIHELAEDLRDSLPARGEALASRLADLDATVAADPVALRRRYDAATRLLCACVLAAEDVDEGHQQRVHEVLRTRLANELAIRGDFSFTR